MTVERIKKASFYTLMIILSLPYHLYFWIVMYQLGAEIIKKFASWF